MIHSTPVKIAIRPSTQRHPSVSPKNPPTIGPRVGPRKGAAAKILIASPRWRASNLLHFNVSLVHRDCVKDKSKWREISKPGCHLGGMNKRTYISAITPPAFVRGEEPIAPAKNRRMSKVWIF